MPQFGNFDPSNGAGQPLNGAAPASGSYLSDRASDKKKYLSGALAFFSQLFRDNNEKLYLNIIFENLTRM